MAETVVVMAPTATKKYIIKSLSIQMPEILDVPPARENIVYAVMDKPRRDGAILQLL